MVNEPKAAPQRKRGRPAGKQRVPLTMEERRARNAQYERERRVEYNDAMAELAEAAGCPEGITKEELLSRVLSMIERSTSSESVSSYAERNERLEQQIQSIEQRLREEEPEITVQNESDSIETCMRTQVVKTSREKVEARNPQQMDCVETESPMQSHVHRAGALEATQSESLPAVMYQPSSPSISPGSEDLGLLDGLDFDPALWTGVGSFGAETPATDIEVDGTPELNWEIENFRLE